MISDQRKHYRVGFFTGGDIFTAPDGEAIGRAVIRDVSSSGMRLEVLNSPEKVQRLFIDFFISERFPFRRIPVQVRRIYRHSGSYLVGVEFLNGSDRRDIRKALAHVIENEP